MLDRLCVQRLRMQSLHQRIGPIGQEWNSKNLQSSIGAFATISLFIYAVVLDLFVLDKFYSKSSVETAVIQYPVPIAN